MRWRFDPLRGRSHARLDGADERQCVLDERGSDRASPSGATLLVETAGCSTCDTIGNGGTLDVTGGELALVGNNSFIAMTGSARLVNSGTVNFTTDGAIGGDSSAVIENHGLFEKTSQSGVRNNYSDIYVPFDNLTGGTVTSASCELQVRRGQQPRAERYGQLHHERYGVRWRFDPLRGRSHARLDGADERQRVLDERGSDRHSPLWSDAAGRNGRMLYMRHDRQRGTLDVTGGELALVGNNSFIAMTGSARLVNSGTVNFTHRWRHIGGEASSAGD